MNQNSRKVIIVGKTGNGKSSLGNNLIANGKKSFTEGGGFNACTMMCQLEKYGQFEIVDTPGLFDTNQNRNVAQQAEQILHALNHCPKPHAFLIVVKYGRFTAEEVSVLDVLGITFGDQYLDHAIVVVTNVENDVTDDAFDNACRESRQVTELVKRCGERVVRIDNKNPDKKHVNDLVQYIDEVSKDGNSCFNNDYLRCHDEVLRRSSQDVNNYDGMLVHEQVEQIANEIKAMVNEEVTREKKEREERARRELEERARRELEERARRERDERARREREERAKREREERAKREREERAKREREEREKQQKENMEKKMTAAALVVFSGMAFAAALFKK